MYTIYIDETGLNEDYTLLGGVIVHSNKYLSICKEIDDLLITSFGTSNLNLKSIRRKVYQENIFSEPQYARFNQGYYDLLKNHKPVFIVTGIKSSYLKEKPDKIRKSYKLLLERFHFFLKKNNDYGQVVYDKGDSCFKHIYEEHKNLIKKGSSWGWEYDRINDIYDKDDEECRVLQIADLLAKGVWSHFNRNDSRHYNRCLPFFDKSSTGQIEGYGVKILC